MEEFDGDVFKQIYEKRDNLFPNLEGLTLSFETGKNLQESDLLSTFLVKGLKSLIIDFRYYDFRDYESYRVYLPSLIHEVRVCSSVTEFTMRCDEDYSPENCENSLYELFIVQTKLKTVKIPLYGLTPLLMKALGRLPALTSLTSEGAGYKSRLEQLVPRLKFDFKLGTFRSLVALEIAGSFADLAEQLAKAPFASRLLHITIHTTMLEKTGSLHSILANIARHGSVLETIGLMAVPPQIQGIRSETGLRNACAKMCRVTLHTLSPMMPNKRLKAFTLTWPCPLEISNRDVISLVRRMPILEGLFLNSKPLVGIGKIHLDLGVLPQLAELRSSIRHLALFLDCRRVPIGPYSQPIRPLPTLESLDLGLSLIPDEIKPLTTFLSKVCPSSCSFPSLPRTLTGEVQAISEKYRPNYRWEGRVGEIGGLISHLAKAREEERQILALIIWEWQEHARHLEEKLDSEKQRCATEAESVEIQSLEIKKLEARITKFESLRSGPKTDPPRRSLRRKSTM